jgi:hypothetical protein
VVAVVERSVGSAEEAVAIERVVTVSKMASVPWMVWIVAVVVFW